MEDVMMATEEFVMVTVPTERVLWLRKASWWPRRSSRWLQNDCSAFVVATEGL